jgi:hypothetical protein
MQRVYVCCGVADCRNSKNIHTAHLHSLAIAIEGSYKACSCMVLRVLLHTTAAIALTSSVVRLTTTGSAQTIARMSSIHLEGVQKNRADGSAGSSSTAAHIGAGLSTESSKSQLLLPSSDDASTNTLKVDGDSISFDHLGPIVLNTDGTLSRIGNWDQMTEPERCATKRMVARRNLERKKMLEEKEQAARQAEPEQV